METERQGNVLVIDDNPVALMAIGELLGYLGYTVREADGSTAALNAFEQHAFDLIVSDINMPGGLTGIELARILCQRDATLPVILVTGFSDSLGASRNFTIVQKLVTAAELKGIVEKELREKKTN